MNRKQKIEILKGIMAGKPLDDLDRPMIRVWVENEDGLTISNGGRTLTGGEFSLRYGRSVIRVRVPEEDL